MYEENRPTWYYPISLHNEIWWCLQHYNILKVCNIKGKWWATLLLVKIRHFYWAPCISSSERNWTSAEKFLSFLTFYWPVMNHWSAVSWEPIRDVKVKVGDSRVTREVPEGEEGWGGVRQCCVTGSSRAQQGRRWIIDQLNGQTFIFFCHHVEFWLWGREMQSPEISHEATVTTTPRIRDIPHPDHLREGLTEIITKQ